jgi:ribosomal protein L37E
MLVWMTLVAGVLLLAAGVVVVVKVDRQWRREHLQCCRCLQTWFGRDKMCSRCGARGKTYDWLAAKFAGFPTHDWQGYLDTGPLPTVVAPIRTIPPADLVPQQRTAVSPDRTTPHPAGVGGDRSTV